ncbi:MAG: hypothetical protein ACK40C_13715 [Novosphingobium meiothermophilum]
MMIRFCDECAHGLPPPPGPSGGTFLCARPVNAAGGLSRHDGPRRGGARRALMVPVDQEREGHRTQRGREKCGPPGRFWRSRRAGTPQGGDPCPAP